MKIIYVTACLPYGPGETFIIGEIRELLRGNQVLVVPRSPGRLGQHAGWLAAHTRCEKLLSSEVWAQALRLFARKPLRVAIGAGLLLRSRPSINTVRNLAVFPKALWLASVAAEWKADHIHCHWAGTTATMAMIASKLSGVPWSLTAHRSDIVSNNLLGAKARSATMVRAIAEDGRAMMISRGVEPSEKLQVIPMGVSIPKAVKPGRPNPPVVLCPADLLAVKGHRYLLEAWKLVQNRGSSAGLWLAGEGELRENLQALAAELQLGDSVRFLGTLKHEALLNLYKRGSISAVTLASVDLGGGCHEGVPVALVEAMSYGIPVISTTTGGIPELVHPGAGLLVPPENPAALADAICRILQNEALGGMIGENGRRLVAESRDVAVIARRLESLFRGNTATNPKATRGAQKIMV